MSTRREIAQLLAGPGDPEGVDDLLALVILVPARQAWSRQDRTNASAVAR
jgi:hypothetical protein